METLAGRTLGLTILILLKICRMYILPFSGVNLFPVLVKSVRYTYGILILIHATKLIQTESEWKDRLE
jgi:hypothetical protein